MSTSNKTPDVDPNQHSAEGKPTSTSEGDKPPSDDPTPVDNAIYAFFGEIYDYLKSIYSGDDPEDNPDMIPPTAANEAEADLAMETTSKEKSEGDGSVLDESGETTVAANETETADAKPEEGETPLTLAEIEALEETAAGGAAGSGGADFTIIGFGNQGFVSSVERFLGIQHELGIQDTILPPPLPGDDVTEAPSIPPDPEDDSNNPEGERFEVFERGLSNTSPQGSDHDLNNPSPNVPPGNIFTFGNVLANDDLGSPEATITKITYDDPNNPNDPSVEYFPDADGIISIPTENGSLTLFTQDFGGALAGDFVYLLSNQDMHETGQDTNAFQEVFSYTLENVAGEGSANLLINVVDDVPIAINDVNGTATENNITIIGNVMDNDVQGADSAEVTQDVIMGTYGLLTLGTNGSYVYTIDPNLQAFKDLGGGGTDIDQFQYTLTDADGDISMATLTIDVLNVDDPVVIEDLTPALEGGDASVDEDDLLASRGPGESEGSDTTKESTTTTGDFKITAPDGVDNLSVGGNAVITNGVFAAVSFTTPLGNTLNITGYDPITGVVTYEYTLNDNETHPDAAGENAIFEDFGVSLSDIDGDVANDTLSIQIVDDVPTANDDMNGTATENNVVLVGNVMDNDIEGADGADVTPAVLMGTYGELMLNADGSYTYTIDPNLQAFKDLGGGGTDTDQFQYTLTDADGDVSQAILTLDVMNDDDPVIIEDLTPALEGGDASVDEDDLLASRGPGESEGSDTTKESTTTTGDFKITAPDGVDTLSVGGNAVITNGVFAAVSFTTPLGNTLNITGYDAGTGVVTYEYTLNDNETHPNAAGENAIFEDFGVSLSDIDGDVANDTLSIQIVDDVPEAHDDVNGTASENNLVLVGNVMDNDVEGADGAAVTPTVLMGTYGELMLNADGSYSYTIDPNLQAFKDLGGGGTDTDQFQYTLTDADGDVSQALLTVDVINDDDPVIIEDLTPALEGGDASVDEDDLLASRGPGESEGSDTTKESTTTTGDFKITAPDGVDTLSVGGNAVITNGVFAAVSFTTPLGNTLNITGYDAGTGVVTYEYTLNDNETHPSAAGENAIFEDFGVSLSDIDGDMANDTLSIQIVDDVPEAHDDIAQVVTEGGPQIGGNVMANDVEGADGATLIAFNYDGGVANVPGGGSTQVTTAIGGTLTVFNNGDWTYVPPASVDNSNGNVPDGFTYTIQDADGDISSAIQPIAIGDGPPPDPEDDGYGPAPDEFIVYESGLDPNDTGVTGSDHDPNNPSPNNPALETTVTGNVLTNDTFGSDPASITQLQHGLNPAVGPDGNGVIDITTANGQMTLYTQDYMGNSAGDFVYTLTADSDHPDAMGNNIINDIFTYTLEDTDGDAANANILVQIVDDVPIAINDCFDLVLPPPPNYNLVFTLDVSGSMGNTVPNTGGQTRLDLLKEALNAPGNLLDSYGDASSALQITIVTFSSDASDSSTFTDINAAKAYIAGLTAGGVTNYNDAITLSNSTLNNTDTSEYINKAYFISDGAPFPANSNSLTPGNHAAWQQTLTDLDVDAIAVNIAPPNVNIDDDLAEIANPSDDPLVINVAPDLSNLGDLLIGTIGDVADVSGNLLDNDVHGADANAIVTDISFSFVDAQAAQDYFDAHPELTGISIDGSVVTIPIPNVDIETPLGQTLTVAANGDITYSIGSDAQDASNDAFNYTIVDTDGDESSAYVCLNVNTAPDPNNDGFGTGPDEHIVYEAGLVPDGSDPAQPITVDGNLFSNDNLGTDPALVKVSYMGVDYTAVNGIIHIDTGDGFNIDIYADSVNGMQMGDFVFTLTAPDTVAGAGNNIVNELFTYTVTNTTGLFADADLLVKVVDDVPQAINDAAKLVEEGGPMISGNVMSNDVSGADTPAKVISFSHNGGVTQVPDNSSAQVMTSVGGLLTVFSTGAWEYTPPASVDNSQGDVMDGFEYTIQDADGDVSSALQPIAISDSIGPDPEDDGFGPAPDQFIVHESGLPSGSDNDPNNLTPNNPALETTVTGNVLSNDTFGNDPASITQMQHGGNPAVGPDGNGVIGITTANGQMTLYTQDYMGNSAGDFVYTLTTDSDHPDAMGNNIINDIFTYTLEDIDGDGGNADILVQIVDDVPTAYNDMNVTNATEDNIMLGGNVMGNDVEGADGATVVPAMLTGTYGTIEFHADGQYTYILDPNLQAFKDLGGGGSDAEQFQYTLVDADGDFSQATLTLPVLNENDPVTIDDLTPALQGGDASVDEDDLADGSDTTKESTTTTGDFSISAPDGVDNLSVGGNAVITNGVFAAVSFTTPLGNTLNITGYDANTGIVSYEYTLNDNETHTDAMGQNALFEDFGVSLSDIDGDIANDTLSIQIVDDVPTAHDDNAHVVTEGSPQISGNVMANDVEGADSASLISFNYNGGSVNVLGGGSTQVTTAIGGLLTVSSNGDWTYTPPASVDNSGGNVPDGFEYTIRDADGDVSSALQPIAIGDGPGPDPEDDGFGPAPDSFTVYDAGLTPDGSDPGQPTMVSGNILTNDTFGSDPASITQVQHGGDTYLPDVNGVIDEITDNGHFILYTQDYMGHTAGDFEFTLTSPGDHPDPSGVDSINELFTYTLEDIDGDSANANLLIQVVDDVPVAVNDCFAIGKPPLPSYNLVFTLDVSGSMGSEVGNTGMSRLDILKEALNGTGNLLDSYVDASAALQITIVTFSTDAQSSTTFTDAAQAKLYIAGLADGGVTNYNAAVTTSDTALDNSDTTGFINKAYFISDGAPYPASNELSPANHAAWQQTLTDLDVDAIAVNIAPPNVNIDDDLAEIANPSDDPLVINVAADLSNLSELLIETIGDVATINGNLMANDTTGADVDATVTDISFSFTSAQDAADYAAANPDLGASVNGSVVTIPIPIQDPSGEITTPLGQTLVVESDGSLTYSINSNAQDGNNDAFSYTLMDADGDISTATVCLDIHAQPEPAPDSAIVYEAGLPGGSDAMQPDTVSGNLLTNDALGSNPALLSVIFMGVEYTPTNGVIHIDTASGAIDVYTESINGHDIGDYSYTLTGSSDHGAGSDSFNEIFTYTVTNTSGILADADLVIQVIDDAPHAMNDGSKLVEEGGNMITGNVMSNDVSGADAPAALVSFSYNGGANSAAVPDGSSTQVTTSLGAILTVFSTGAWEYTPPTSVDNSQGNVDDSFSYTISDTDGDISSATQPIAITDGIGPDPDPDGFGTAPDSFSVYEAGLGTGSDPDGASSPKTATGNVLSNDDLGSDPASITSVEIGGNTYTPVNGVITADIGHATLTLYTETGGGHTAGDFEYILTGASTHATGMGNNSFDDEFEYTVTDIDGDSASAPLKISVVDDVPTAVMDQDSIEAPALPSYNLIFNLDVSGSMGTQTGNGTRLDVLKAALIDSGALIDSYVDASAALNITIISFSTGATLVGTYSGSVQDINNLKSDVNALDDNGWTNYVQPLNISKSVMADNATDPALDGFINRVYFISDGEITRGGTPDYGEWQDYLDPNDAPLSTAWDAVSINIGTASDADLAQIANPTDDPAVIHVESDLSNLEEILVDTIGGTATVDGNVMTNDTIGADMPGQVSQISFTLADNQAAQDYLAAHPELAGASVVGATVMIPIPNADITTPLGGELQIDEHGAYTYTAFHDTQVGNETFTYRLMDSDGDTSDAQFLIEVTSGMVAPFTASVPPTKAPDTTEAFNDMGFTATHTEYSDNLLGNDAIGQMGSKVAGISFATDNAQEYIDNNFLDGLGATADQDGVTVHIPLSDQQSEVSFTTELGATLTLNQQGDYTYNIGGAHQTAVEHFQYDLQDVASGNTHQANFDMNVIVLPDKLVSLEGSDGSDKFNAQKHKTADVLTMEGHDGADEYIVHVSAAKHPEKIVIMDLGISKENVLTFKGVKDFDNDGARTLMDAVLDFEQDGANVSMTLHNNSTLVLQNVGTVAGNDVQALEQHLQTITQELNVQK